MSSTSQVFKAAARKGPEKSNEVVEEVVEPLPKTHRKGKKLRTPVVPIVKIKVILTHKNLLKKASVYYKYKMQSELNSTIPGVVLRILKSSQFYQSYVWVVPLQDGGIDYGCVASLWKAMMFLDLIEMDDVTKIFFEQPNLASQQRALGREQLALDLTATKERVEHNYILIDDDVETIFVAPAEKDDLPAAKDIPESSSNGARHQSMTTTSAPMYIPVYNHKRNFDHGF